MAGRNMENVAEEEGQRLLGDGEQGRYDIKQASLAVRKGFVRKVYGILTGQLILTTLIAYIIFDAGKDRSWLRKNEWLLWVSVGITITLMCVMACCENFCRNFPTNYIFLFVFTAFEATMIGFISALYSWESVLLATGVTMTVFFTLTGLAVFTNGDFTGCGPYLFVGLVVLLLFGIVLAVLPAFGLSLPWLTALYDVLAVLIFCFYIVFDTQLILGEWGGHRLSFSIDDYCFAALNLYMDIINLFIHLLALLGRRD